MTRSGKIRGEQTKILPLKDGLYLAATLKPAPAEDKLRDALAEGQKVVLAAFVSTNLATAVATAPYTVVSGVLTPDDPNNALRVPTGQTYHFVAYSFNSTTPPVATAIDPENDLMWGRTAAAVPISGADQPVTIVMKHKFSQVRMTMNVTGIVGATVVMNAKVNGGLKVDLDVGSGSVEAIDEDPYVDQVLDFPATAADVAVSEWRTVTPTYDPLYPQKVSVTIDGTVINIGGEGDYPFYNQTIVFDGPVAEGTQYELEVNLRRTRWAWSNVYWDIVHNRMTFDQSAPSENVNTYQGLFFMWGSLVGISPSGNGTGVDLYIASSDSQGWPTTTVGATNHGYWTPSGGTGTSGWTSIPNAYNALYAWPGVADDLDANCLTDITDVSILIGDICTFIDNEWRMPTANEFGEVTDYGTFISGSSSSDVYGTGEIGSGRVYNSAFGSVFLPASGARFENGWDLDRMGIVGLYWTASRLTYGGPLFSGFLSTEIGIEPDLPICTHSVRCIRKLASEL
jgi:hypothetical protein